MIIAFAVILFLAVLSFISYVLSDDKTEGFEPYQDVETSIILIPEPDPEKEYFTDEVIASMKKMVSPRYSQHPHWIRAFILYNQSHPTLSMLCAPCYIKVLQYIIKLKNENDNKEKGGQDGC